MKRKMFALALAMAAGTASAQNSIVSDQAGTFVDISGVAGVNTLINGLRQDDSTFAFTSTVTNAIFSSTTVRVCTNGYAQWGGTAGSTAYTNAAIPATGAPVGLANSQALLPQWDDMLFVAGDIGEIYWVEGPAASFGLPAGRGNVLIIQWSNAPHYDAGNPVGAATFEIQVFQNVVGNVAAQMLYSDVSYDDARFDGGISATVGFVSGTTGGAASLNNVQWSFNADTGLLTDGLVLSLLVPSGPTNPSVSGAVNPSSAAPGDTVLFTANPSGGINPNSTNMVVRGDLTAVGGLSNALFHDDGLNGDAAAGDNTYSYQYTIPAATPGGNYSVGLTVTDAQARSGSGTITGNIFNPQDLGTLVDGTNVSTDVPLEATEIKWYRATIGDCSVAAHRNLLITTANSQNGGDSEIGFFDAAGTLVATNDDSVGLLSRLTFGYQGTSGDVGPGLYYVAVGTFNVNYSTPFGAVSTGGANDFQLDILQTNSFPPTATGAVAALGNNQYLLTVNVTPGTNPDSTGIAVTGDLSGAGGPSNAAFHDDGQNGDASAGDNIFSYIATSPAGDPDGTAYTVNYTVTDQQSNNVSGTLSFTSDAAGDTPATAYIPSGSGDLSTVDGFLSPTDADMFKIEICDPGNFSASTVGSAVGDTQLFLFDESGMGVACDDDNPAGGLQSVLTGTFVPAPGTYYLAVSSYNNDPVDAGAGLIWANTPFNVERSPDGPSAGSPLDHWTGAGGYNAAYTINFTGTCYPSNNTQCSVADVGIAGGLAGHDHLLNNNDFIAFITLFFASDPQADMGVAGGLPGSDGQWNNNDFIAFIGHFFEDAAHCNG